MTPPGVSRPEKASVNGCPGLPLNKSTGFIPPVEAKKLCEKFPLTSAFVRRNGAAAPNGVTVLVTSEALKSLLETRNGRKPKRGVAPIKPVALLSASA